MAGRSSPKGINKPKRGYCFIKGQTTFSLPPNWDGWPLKLFSEVRELSQEGSFICVLEISNLYISTIFLLNAGTVSTVQYIFFSLYLFKSYYLSVRGIHV
jgi:hypothetical protein